MHLAFDNYEKCLAILKTSGDQSRLAETQITISQLYYEQKEYQTAKKYLDSTFSIISAEVCTLIRTKPNLTLTVILILSLLSSNLNNPNPGPCHGVSLHHVHSLSITLTLTLSL